MKKRALSLALAVVSSITMLSTTACGPQEPTNLEGELNIALYEGGFGVDFLDHLIEGYKAKNPGVTINEPEYFIGGQPAIDMIKSGPEENGIDLFIAGSVVDADLVEQGDTIWKGYDPILEDLTDVYNSKAYGDEITIAQKMIPSIKGRILYEPNLNAFPQYEKYSGKAYSLPWAFGPGGLILNKTFMDANPQYEVPNTTDELAALVDTIYADCVTGKPDNERVYPVIWAGSNAAAYWRYTTMVWIAQYDGLEAWDRHLRTVDENGNFSDTVYNMPGQLKALEALAPIISSEKCYPNSIGTKHVDAQVQFMRGKAAILPSGDWTENETVQSDSFGTAGPNEIIMIRTPVISALGEKLGITDEQLSAIVDAVDEGKTSLNGISQTVFDQVKQARFITTDCDAGHNMFIPAYSNAKEIAKDFIKYMYSDEGIEIFMQYANGYSPMQYEVSEEMYNEFSAFRKSTYSLCQTGTMIDYSLKYSPIRYKNNLPLYTTGSGYVENLLGKREDPATPAEIMEDCYEYIHNRWNTFLRIAGVR